MSTSVSFKWNKPIPTIAKEATGGDAATLFMANEARRLMNTFVPYRDGNLRDNVLIYAEDGKGIVHYVSPYAHYQYVGVAFNRTTGGTTAYWDRAMMQVRGGDLVSAVQGYIGRG